MSDSTSSKATGVAPASHASDDDEQAYQAQASRELTLLLDALDELGDDVEVELASDIITLEFRDGARFVLNSHRAARQLWLAARTSAWHFNFDADEGCWRCSRSGAELWQVLSEQLTQKLGRTISLAPGASPAPALAPRA